MRKIYKRAVLWLSLGLIFSLLTLVVVFTGLAGTALVTHREEVPEAAEAVLTMVRDGHWDTLEAMTAGRPALSPDTGPEASAENRIFEAYRESLSWGFPEPASVQDARMIQQVTVTCLDIPGVTDRIAEIMAQTLPDPEDSLSREQMLYAAAESVLETDPPMTERTIILAFQRQQGQWLLVPDRALLALLSGFTVT